MKVYPFKTVEAGRRHQLLDRVGVAGRPQSLFGRDGVAGLANVDITPELATRVAMAYATTLKKDATVITSRDSSRSARMLKRAMMAGAQRRRASTCSTSRWRRCPVTRFLVRQPESAGRPHHPPGRGRPAVGA